MPVAQRVRSLVCVPYGGGSAVVYQPLADALPAGHRLFSVAIPGHDVGLDEEALPFDELAERCTAEILAKVDGPLALYGHCGVGSALAVEIARRLEQRGRDLDAVYIGAVFPFARPRSRVWTALSRLTRMESLRSDRAYANWLISMGVDMSDIEPGQARQIIRNMRRDSDSAEAYFTDLMHAGTTRLRAPIITVAGERDPATEFSEERFTEWHFLTDRAAARRARRGRPLLPQVPRRGTRRDRHHRRRPGGRAGGAADRRRGPGGWCSTSRSTRPGRRRRATQPSMRRFLAVALAQLVSIIGSALTELRCRCGSPGDRVAAAVRAARGRRPRARPAGRCRSRARSSTGTSRRRVMLGGDIAAGGTQLLLGLLLWTGSLQIWHIYPLVALLSVALAFQRLAYGSAVPQLVPKRYLGHANGVVQMLGGVAVIMVPLLVGGAARRDRPRRHPRHRRAQLRRPRSSSCCWCGSRGRWPGVARRA